MVVLYLPACGEPGKRLLRIIETVVSKENIIINRTIDELSGYLRRPRNDMNVAVLLAYTRMDLFDLLSIRDLLRDMKVILILPDSHPDTFATGHILRPRFVSDCESNFQEVSAVLSRMIGNLGTNGKQ